ncbi:hypothetical protein MKK55_18000 [Methylobacterium sp. J-059]|uniref:hypothetical protein n=1 Tax=Methylobacterium sp. J-059 TaxID=2836643 RepID=UPI001FB9E07D|nr:hypothetical protein [Methylobacterium sp. J-059]MCJ2040826.1 hypothetical protein [Methylobacterium sp. J-059]
MAADESLEQPVVLRDEAVVRLLLAECMASGTRAKWASANGVSPQYVTDVLKGRRAPGDSILRGLGLARDVVYVPRQPEAVS